MKHSFTLGLLLISRVAVSCPDFSGVFTLQSATDTVVMRQDQVGCEKLNYHVTVTPVSGTPSSDDGELVFDGVLKEIDPEAGREMYRLTYLQDSTLVETLIGVTPDSTHPGMVSMQSRFTLDAAGNFVNDFTLYDQQGNPTKTGHEVYLKSSLH